MEDVNQLGKLATTTSTSISTNKTANATATANTNATKATITTITTTKSMDVNSLQFQFDNLSVIHPPLMYEASTDGSADIIRLQQNISIVYEDLLGTSGSGINGSLYPTRAAAVSPVSSSLPAYGNGSGIGIAASNESIASDEWTHFYDLILSWQGICLVAVFSIFIVVTVIGNTLVILAVITTRRLKTVTNCFVMSLAVADLLVGIFVMPPAVAVHLVGSWQLGWILCDIWISLDVLLCTASILSLCAISVDRYLAVTRPLTYSRKRRSKRLALIMILIVWLLALAITCPPMLGWYEPGRRDLSECRYNQNEGYVIFSAMGSFFIPMAVMIYVYAKISCVIASRHDNMTDISVHNKKFLRYTAADIEHEIDHDFSEQEQRLATHNKQAAARTMSNQSLPKETHEILPATGEVTTDLCTVPTNDANGADLTQSHALLTLPAPRGIAKNDCYELTRPSTLKRTSSSLTTMTTMTSSIGPGSSLLDSHWQAQQQLQSQQAPRTHNFRHSHLSKGAAGVGAAPQSDRLRSHHHHAASASSAAGAAAAAAVASSNSKSSSNRITSLRKENKTTQTLSIVVGGFIACWLPFFICYLITPFLSGHQVSRTLAKALTWLGWFNSAINPFIYAFYSVDFRAAFWRLTCKRFFSVAQKPQFPTNTMSTRR